MAWADDITMYTQTAKFESDATWRLKETKKLTTSNPFSEMVIDVLINSTQTSIQYSQRMRASIRKKYPAIGQTATTFANVDKEHGL